MRLNLADILYHVLNESVQPNEVVDAINNKEQIIITYSDEKNHAPQTRLIEPYVYGISKGGNPCIRAFQYQGDTYRGIPKWKMFRLDRITSWRPNGQTFTSVPKDRGWNVEAYNEHGDNSMIQVLNQVSFDKGNARKSEKDNSKVNTQATFGPKKPKQNKDQRDTFSPEFNDMIKRNLEISRKEKERRFGKKQEVEQPQDSQEEENNNIVNQEVNQQTDPQHLSNMETHENRPRGPRNVKPQSEEETTSSEINNNDDEFQKMLRRNLEITQKEKAKRGFSLNNNVTNGNNRIIHGKPRKGTQTNINGQKWKS